MNTETIIDQAGNKTAEVHVPEEQPAIELAIVRGSTSGVFVLDETGITLADDTTLEQWREGLRMIKWFKDKIAIGLADYIEWGKGKFGVDKVDQVLEQLEFDASFVKTALTITGIPDDIRFSNLGAEHYVEIAKANLPKSGQVKWAKIASEQHLTATQLRYSIRENQVVDREAAKALQTGVITIHGIRQQFDVWANRVGGLDGILKMDRDHQEEIMGELESIVNLGVALKINLTGVSTG